MSLITLHNEKLTVVLSTLGAEIQSIKDAAGIERIWQGDPAFWTGRAPVLFPIAGGLKDNRYTLDGITYEMPKHGFVRQLEWLPECQSDDSVTFLMTEKHEGFPFDYELRSQYRLDGCRLVITYRVGNLDDRAFVFSIGSHEAYATPEGIEAYEIAFDEPERLACNPVLGTLIGTEPEPLFESASLLPLKSEYFQVDAMVLLGLKSRGVTLRSREHGRTVRVDYPGFDVLLLWTRPGAGYLCIEPWCNAPDFVDADGDIMHKPGCIRLEPGQACEKTHTLTFLG